MSSSQYNALPQGYASRTKTSFEPFVVGGMFVDREYTVPIRVRLQVETRARCSKFSEGIRTIFSLEMLSSRLTLKVCSTHPSHSSNPCQMGSPKSIWPKSHPFSPPSTPSRFWFQRRRPITTLQERLYRTAAELCALPFCGSREGICHQRRQRPQV